MKVIPSIFSITLGARTHVCSHSDSLETISIEAGHAFIFYVNVGRIGTLSYNSFRWRSISLFNSLPMHLRSISSCSVLRFKTQLYIFLGSMEDLPCLPGFNNSLDGGDCSWWSPCDGLATN